MLLGVCGTWVRCGWYRGTVLGVRWYGAGGTVVRCRGYCGGVRWVRWRGAVGTVEGCGGCGGCGGYGGQWGSGDGGATVGAVEGGYTGMVEKYEDEGRKVQIAALTRGRYLSTSC